MKAGPVIGLCLLGLLANPAGAESLGLPPGATLEIERLSDVIPARFPIGPFRDGDLPFVRVDSPTRIQVWKIPGASRTTSQAALALRADLSERGYEILLDCLDADCGGFDFRYALDLVEEPVMHVDLSDFRHITARKPGTDEYLGLMISRGPSGIFLQLDSTDGSIALPANALATAPPSPPLAPTQLPVEIAAAPDIGAAFETDGWLTLDDLTFGTGSSDLSEGVYPSLRALAFYLLANPEITVALVGHTDAQGSLATNIAVSRKRAASVVERLATSYGVPRAQLDAQGVGFLAPRWSSLTDAGRRKNRRVEVVLTSTP